jgi:apolipoprotein D and lipocalin family protein
MQHFIVLLVAGVLLLVSCRSKPLDTVPELDIERYSGTWYEIARLPNRFERGLKCVTATYTLREDGRVTVFNQGHKIDDPAETQSIEGVAWVPNNKEPGRLKVRFFWPFSAGYYVMALGNDYEYALVGSPSRRFLWILARDPQMAPDLYNKLTETARAKGFDTSEMIRVEHDCDGNAEF